MTIEYDNTKIINITTYWQLVRFQIWLISSTTKGPSVNNITEIYKQYHMLVPWLVLIVNNSS